MMDMPFLIAANDLCVNACLYNEDKGCLPGAQANADRCFIESLGKRVMEVEGFIREEAKKLPPEPPPAKKGEKPPEPEKKPEQTAKAPEPPKPAPPPPAPKAAEPPKPAAEGAGTAAMSGADPSTSPLPMSLWRKPEDITDE
jgi:hypothetical protein